MPEIISFKIFPGGRKGVGRAALNVALELGIPCGGWCSKGRRAEEGPVDPQYPLKEIKSEEYPIRTEANVIEADGTLILTMGEPTGGAAYTVKMAVKAKNPYLIVDLKKKTGLKRELTYLSPNPAHSFCSVPVLQSLLPSGGRQGILVLLFTP